MGNVLIQRSRSKRWSGTLAYTKEIVVTARLNNAEQCRVGVLVENDAFVFQVVPLTKAPPMNNEGQVNGPSNLIWC